VGGVGGDPFVKTDFVVPSKSHFVFLSLVLHSGVYFLLEKKSQKDISKEEKQATQNMRLKSLPCGKTKVALLCVKENISMSQPGSGSIQRATYFEQTILLLCQ
jgi:hypothetical protein